MTTFVDQTTLLTATWLNAVAAVIESAAVSAISLTTPAADTFPYFTGASAASVSSLSPFARTLLDDADAASMRSTLGVSGYASDSLIDALVELSTSADTGLVFTGPDMCATYSLTPAARGLLDDANAAAMRTTLEVQPTASPTFTGTATFQTVYLNNNDLGGIKTFTFYSYYPNGNSGTSKTIDWGLGNFQTLTMTGNCTLTFTGPPGPCILHLDCTQDGTGSRAWTLPANVLWDSSYSAGDKLLSTAAGTRDKLELTFNGLDYVATLRKGIA